MFAGTGPIKSQYLSFIFAAVLLASSWLGLAPAWADSCQSGDCQNGFGTYVRDSGNKYTGEFKNGKFHGHGTYTFNEDKWKGDQYVGEFQNGRYNGLGTYSWNNGDIYTGDFKDDAPNGHGTYTWGREPWKGDRYVGEFKQWKKEGFGTYYWKNGDKYVGEFQKDASNGTGTYTHANGDVYTGGFKEWKKHGKGEFIWNSGSLAGNKFTGDFKDDKMTGQGTKVFANGDQYEGSWVDGNMQGFGTFQWKNGKKYTGNWNGGKENGHGTLYYSDGDKYDGEFKNGKFEGQGIYTWAREPWTGDQYNGEFKNDELDGYGTKIYGSGDKYTGEWVNWKKEGYGTYTWKNGDAYSGQWKDSKMHGQGTFTYANGSRDVGTWENDKPTKVVHYEPGQNKENFTPPVVAKKTEDTTPPVITITSHETSRGIIPVPLASSVLVEGIAMDDSGVQEVLINNVKALVQPNGKFSANITLQPGRNNIMVLARDTQGNTAQNGFWLDSSAPKEPGTMTAHKQDLGDSFTEGLDVFDSGSYHAIVIGINDYKHLPKLQTAVNDAQKVEKVLRQQYGFKTKLLIDASRSEIMRAFTNARKTMSPNDSLLIYYAGHGEFDKSVNKAYWLPVDSEHDSEANWIIVDTLTSSIKRFASKHVLIVADSCYSGTLTRAAITNLNTPQERMKFLEKMNQRSSRTLMASGGNEPVADGGGGGHSVFARAFIEALQQADEKVFTAEQLFYNYIKEPVAGRAEQVPEYNIIKNSGHGGGDFVFVKKSAK